MNAAVVINDSDIRLTVIGPMPPPINGQSLVMKHTVSELRSHYSRMRVADLGEVQAAAWLRPLLTLSRSVGALWSIRGADNVYVAVKAGRGMWLTTASAGVARMVGATAFLHHHSYAYIRQRKFRMVALSRIAGPQARHIVLSKRMAEDLKCTMPEIRHTLISDPAWLVDRKLLELETRADNTSLILGHLSNLSESKGIVEVVDLAVELVRANVRARLIIGGPVTDKVSLFQLERAARELGELFEYRGALVGGAKRAFFGEITHFVFPTRYVHEAVPAVLYEAMAGGAVCVSTRQGSIPEQLHGSPHVLAESADSFVEETLPVLAATKVSARISERCREAFRGAVCESEEQLRVLVGQLGEQR